MVKYQDSFDFNLRSLALAENMPQSKRDFERGRMAVWEEVFNLVPLGLRNLAKQELEIKQAKAREEANPQLTRTILPEGP